MNMSNETDIILAHFEKISSVPRGTKYEAGIRQWLIDWAGVRGFKSQADTVGNLFIYIPASAGRETSPTLILQGHLDMVWQKTPDSDHDFTRDPIRLLRDADWIKADRTTLGADNGIAIALMMALAEEPSLSHPTLELLLTVEEEQGVGGASNLDPALLSGKSLINLDSEEEGVFTIGCAGGASTYITLRVSWSPVLSDEVSFEIKVGGLKGGHSGEDINKHSGNANKIIARVLDFIQKATPIRLSVLKGGSARNAIPRDAEAGFVCAKESAAICNERFTAIRKAIQAKHLQTEPGLSITLVERARHLPNAISLTETQKGIQLLVSLPNGVASMSAEIPGFVETSNNIGIMELKEGGLLIVSNQRSSSLSRLEEMAYRMEALALLAGTEVEQTKPSPPWQPNTNSILRKRCEQVYESAFGRKPKFELSHGGLECGIISDRCSGLDTISLGPTIENPHSPDERLYIPSLRNIWKFLTEYLRTD